MSRTVSNPVYLPVEGAKDVVKDESVHWGEMPREAPLATGKKVNVTISVDNLETLEPLVYLSTATQKDIPFTLSEIKAIGELTKMSELHADQLVETARLQRFHPLHSGFEDHLKDAGYSTTPQTYPKSLCLATDSPDLEGTPILRWTKRNALYTEGFDGQDGWTLGFVEEEYRLSGNVSVGFARWDSPEGIENLIGLMSDRESMSVMAGMQNADAMRKLSARQTARTIMETRGLPRMTISPVREFLQRNALTTSEKMIRGYRGKLRLLPVRLSGNKNLAVAVGILSPENPATPAMMATLDDVRRRLSYKEYEEVRKNQYAIWRDEWEARLIAVLPSFDGWRQIDLPPTPGASVVWVTRFDHETWDSVAAAAEREAPTMNMDRGGVF